MLQHLIPSLVLTIIGFAISAVAGVFLALVVSYSDTLRRSIYPIIVASQVIPKIAVAPLFVVWFGAGATSALLMAVLIAFFPMTINAMLGFASLDEDVEKMAKSFMGTPMQIFWKVRLPNALPYIFSGMKISLTLAIIGVVVSEFVASQKGIGYLIKLQGGLLDTPLMMSAIAVLSISGIILYWAIGVVEKRVVYWTTTDDTISGLQVTK